MVLDKYSQVVLAQLDFAFFNVRTMCLQLLSYDELFHICMFLSETKECIPLQLVSSAMYHNLSTNQLLYRYFYYKRYNSQVEEFKLSYPEPGTRYGRPNKRKIRKKGGKPNAQHEIEFLEKEISQLEKNHRTDWVKAYRMKTFSNTLRKMASDMMLTAIEYPTYNFLHYVKQVLKPIHEHVSFSEDMNKSLKRAATQALHTVRKTSILHIILTQLQIYLKEKKQLQSEIELITAAICSIIDMSKLSNGKTCLTIPNNVQLTPMHLVISTRNEYMIKTIMTRYASELASCEFNKAQGGRTSPTTKALQQPIRVSLSKRIETSVSKRVRRVQRGVSNFIRISNTLMRPLVNELPMNLLNTLLLYYTSHSAIELLDELKICDISALVKEPCVRSGNYPLHIVCHTYIRSPVKRKLQSQIMDTADYLIEKGADVTVKNSHGYSPMAFLIYNHEWYSCFVNQSHTIPMMKLLMDYTIEDLLNDSYPIDSQTVIDVILINWNYDKKMFKWMFEEEKAIYSDRGLEKLITFETVDFRGHKLRFLKNMGYSMTMKKELKEAYEKSLQDTRNPFLSNPHALEIRRRKQKKSRYHLQKSLHRCAFWQEALFNKRL
jgi:hypothetical protein